MNKRITVNYINSTTDENTLKNIYESLSVDSNYMFSGCRDTQAIWNRESFISLHRRWEAVQERMVELNVTDMDGQNVKYTNFGDIVA